MRYVILVLASAVALGAQPWSGILDTARATDWTTAGAGTILVRSTVCATLNPGATAAEINAAIAGCPAGQVVYLAAGTYNLDAGLVVNDLSNITIRGAGPSQTRLLFSSSYNCGGVATDLCIKNGHTNYAGNPINTANWTAGYAKGSASITLSATTNLQVGSLLILDQENDSNTDTGDVWVCGTGGTGACCVTCASGQGRPGPPARQQTQTVRVLGIDGSTVTIEDPIDMPQFRAERNPGAWWSSDTPIIGVGIENLSMDHTASNSVAGVHIINAYGAWFKGIRSINSGRNHIWMYQCAHLTVRDSYFYGTRNAASQSYGVENFTSSKNLIENNIFQHVTSPLMSNSGTAHVYGYNFSEDNYYTTSPTWIMPIASHHGPGISYFLLEGNHGVGLRADYFHGLSHFVTLFRNRFHGFEAGKMYQTIPLYLQMGHRYYSAVGNVLGSDAYHLRYESAPPTNTNCNTSIFSLGWGGLCASGTLPDDALVASTLMRWGNYDTVNDTTRWESTEVPSADASYPNTVPASQVLPASFYHVARPAWWGSAVPWPAIGPDVTEGNIADVGGHANKIPAQVMYESLADDPAYDAGTVKLFAGFPGGYSRRVTGGSVTGGRVQ